MSNRKLAVTTTAPAVLGAITKVVDLALQLAINSDLRAPSTCQEWQSLIDVVLHRHGAEGITFVSMTPHGRASANIILIFGYTNQGGPKLYHRFDGHELPSAVPAGQHV